MHHMLMNSVRAIAAGCVLAVQSLTPASADNQANLNIMGAFPQKGFKQNVDAGIGLNGGYTYGFFSDTAVSLRLGGDAGFIIYGNETRTEPFSTTIPDVTVDVETMNNIVQFGLVGQLAATTGAIRPYLEAKAGFSYFYTETKIKNTGKADEEEIASSTNFDDTTGYTALGGGFLIPVYAQTDPAKGRFTVSVDLRFNYWWGGNAEYLKKGSIKRENGKVTYDISKSSTDMTSAHLGVAVNF
jgi:hypothetical protein